MKIESLRIKGFRSLYDLEFKPSKFTVLVGPNNAGKSTIVDAFDFLADVYRHGLEIALNRKGGFENVAHRRMRRTKRPIIFEVNARVPLLELVSDRRRHFAPRDLRVKNDFADLDVRINHTFSVRAATQAIAADFSVVQEHVHLQLMKGNRVAGFLDISRNPRETKVQKRKILEVSDSAWEETIDPFDDDTFLSFIREPRVSDTELLTSILRINDCFSYFSRHLQASRVFRLSPIECRRTGVPTPNADLELHGGNLPALVWLMSHFHKDQWARVIESMRRVVPGLEDVDVAFSHDRRLVLKFQEESVGRPWTSEEISDGTIQSLALFSVIHDPRVKFLIIEEPENSVHAWIVRQFVDVCRATKDKQIMLTTHSATLIDYLRPEEVSLVWRRKGRTSVSPLIDLDPQLKLNWESGSTTIFEFLDSGFVREAVPGGPD